MAYLGTPPRSQALTSADISDGAVTLADISFTDTPSNLNLNGIYDNETMRLAHNVTATGDVTLNNSNAFTASPSSGLLLSSAGHNLSNDDQIQVQSNATLPTGLSGNTHYYVISKTDDTFKLSTSRGGTAITYTNTGSGTHTWYKDVNLVLAKISDDGNPVTLTNDSSTRLLSGIGSIQAGTLTQTPNASLTGMTGEIGSAVTGTLGSDIVFPAGHIVQIVSDDITTAAESDNTNSGTLILVERGSNIYDWKKQITGVTAGNWVYVTMGFKFFSYRATTDVLGCGFGIFHSTADDGSGTSVIYEQAGDTQYFHIAQASGGSYQNAEYIQFSYMHKLPNAGNNTYYLGYKGQNNGSDHVRVMSQAIAGATGGTPFHVTLMEIQQ